MSGSDVVRLLELEPDLARFMNEVDREAVGDLTVPVTTVPAGELDVATLLAAERAFAAILLEGMLVRRMVVGEAATLRLLGPGDLLAAPAGGSSMLITGAGWRAAVPTRAAVLGRDVLLAAHRAPRLVAGLQARGAEQADRVALQLAICQLPRVEDRVLSMLWLLAESWGQVTPSGTVLRLRLTHETLGGLVGARRSTITLALSQLTEDGAILRSDGGWMLIEPPPGFTTAARAPARVAPEILEAFDAPPRDLPSAPDTYDVLARARELREVRDELARVRARTHDRINTDLERARALRDRSVQLRREARARRASASGIARLHHYDGAGDAIGAAQGQADDPAAEGLASPVDRVED